MPLICFKPWGVLASEINQSAISAVRDFWYSTRGVNDETKIVERNGHVAEADDGALKEFLPGLFGHILSKIQDKDMGDELLSERQENSIGRWSWAWALKSQVEPGVSKMGWWEQISAKVDPQGLWRCVWGGPAFVSEEFYMESTLT